MSGEKKEKNRPREAYVVDESEVEDERKRRAATEEEERAGRDLYSRVGEPGEDDAEVEDDDSDVDED